MKHSHLTMPQKLTTMALAAVTVEVLVLVVKKSSPDRQPAGVSVFRAACLKQVALNKNNPALCDSIQREFFQTNETAPLLAPESIGAPQLPVDKKAKIIAIADPRYVAQLAYCYFQFRAWFDPKAISPEALALAASGFAILKEELQGYQDWLGTKAGEDCKSRVRAYTNEEPIDLDSLFKEYESLIAINPLAAIQEGKTAEDIKKEALLTINHERIHVLQVLCASLNRTATKMWNDLAPVKKAELKKKISFLRLVKYCRGSEGESSSPL